jgi:hypothetical protein
MDKNNLLTVAFSLVALLRSHYISACECQRSFSPLQVTRDVLIHASRLLIGQRSKVVEPVHGN